MPARLDLAKHLYDDCCLAAASISDDLEMLVLGTFGYAQKIPALVHLDSDSGSSNGFVELLWRYENWTLQPPPILHFLPPADVLGNRPGQLHEEEDSSQKNLESEHLREGLARVDFLPQIALNACARESQRPTAKEESDPSLPGGIGECQRNRFAGWLRCRARCYILAAHVPCMTFCVRHEQHPVLGVERNGCRDGCLDVGGQVELFEWRQRQLESEIDEKSGCNQRQKQRANGVDGFMRRPDDGLFPAPGCFSHIVPPSPLLWVAPGFRAQHDVCYLSHCALVPGIRQWSSDGRTQSATIRALGTSADR